MNRKNGIFRKWGWIIFWAVASILFAVLIHCLFSNEASTDFFIAKWGAGDILSYISTVSLGLLAMWQNQKITLDSEKQDIRNRAIEKSVVFDFDNVKCYFYNSDDDIELDKPASMIENGFNGDFAVKAYKSNIQKDRVNLSIQIKNLSDYIATNLRIDNPDEMEDCNSNILHDINGENVKRYILAGNCGTIKLDFPCVELSSPRVFKLCFSNQFGDKYCQDIKIYADGWIVRISTQATLNILKI